MRQERGDVQLSPRRVRPESENRLQQCKDRACCPGLRYIGPEILDRKTPLITLNRRVQFRELVGQEMAARFTDIAGDFCDLGTEAITFAPCRDNRIVV